MHSAVDKWIVAQVVANAHLPILRCAVTGNIIGTDCWMRGYFCPCASCHALRIEDDV